MKFKNLFVCTVVTSVSCFALAKTQDALSSEYSKEIAPIVKKLNESKAFLQPLVDKQMSGKKITAKESEQLTMMGCYNQQLYKKTYEISSKPKYKNLERAQRAKKGNSAILRNFAVDPTVCAKYGLD